MEHQINSGEHQEWICFVSSHHRKVRSERLSPLINLHQAVKDLEHIDAIHWKWPRWYIDNPFTKERSNVSSRRPSDPVREALVNTPYAGRSAFGKEAGSRCRLILAPSR